MGIQSYHFPMKILLNGEPTEIPQGETVADLLRRLSLADRPCAAEVNKRLVPRKDHALRHLREGDVVEVVTLVGGG